MIVLASPSPSAPIASANRSAEGQHVRQRTLGIAHGVEIEADRAGNVPLGEFGRGIAAGGRHVPRCVDRLDVGIVQAVGKPVGGYDGGKARLERHCRPTAAGLLACSNCFMKDTSASQPPFGNAL